LDKSNGKRAFWFGETNFFGIRKTVRMEECLDEAFGRLADPRLFFSYDTVERLTQL
ncbi:hypothetical protein HDU84_001391, partial [Entophlyctis sp. JEL0112]